MSLTDKEALIVLNSLPKLGSIRIRKILRKFEGKASAVFKGSQSQLTALFGSKIADLVFFWEKHFDLGLEQKKMMKLGLSIISFQEREYPALLKEIYDFPICLYLRGEKKCLSSLFNLAVVGARKPSNYALSHIKRIVGEACQRGCQIISGLAYGVDTIAHQVAVDSEGGKTIAVMAHGFDYIYPMVNRRLYEKILERQGLIISEFPISQKPERYNFPIRNRIISGLSHGVLIGQASFKSGSLITAKQALDQNREIFALPGYIGNDFQGNHSLIKQGAKLTESFNDILEEFPNLTFKEKKGGVRSSDLSDEEGKILSFFRDPDRLDIEGIMGKMGPVIMGEVLALLTQMEVKKLISFDGVYYKKN